MVMVFSGEKEVPLVDKIINILEFFILGDEKPFKKKLENLKTLGKVLNTF